MIDSERAARFDVFSNVHYGFIFAEMLVSEQIAQAAANSGEIWGPLRAITGSNDAVDVLAVSVGYQLHDAVPAGDPPLLVYSSTTRDLLLLNFDQFVQLGGACRVGDC